MNGIREVDHGWNKFQEIAKALGGNTNVKVGVLDDGSAGSDKRESGYTNAQIAAVHEFGSSDGRIPQRSFMRASFDKHRPDNLRALEKLLAKVVEGKLTVDALLNTMGAKIAADMKNFVTQGDGVPPPNAPSTLARKEGKTRKGSSGAVRTLIDTGRMIGSITWALVKR